MNSQRSRRQEGDLQNFRLAGPDHLRALAITLVFIFHYRLFPHPPWIDTLGSFGWTGVDLFFVLSGYLIAGQLFRELPGEQSISLSAFFTRRFFRIVPAYIAVLAVYYCVPAFREREALPPLWKFITFSQNFGLDLRRGGTFSHAWSLCIEEQFYLLFPFLILSVRFLGWGRRGAILVVAMFLAGFLCRLLSWQHILRPLSGTEEFGLAWYRWMYYPTYNRLDGLLVGVCIAGIQQFYPAARRFMERRGNLLLITGLLLLTAAYMLCLEPRSFEASLFGFPLIAIGYGCLLAAALSPACMLYRFRSGITAGAAALSYAIYLVHKGIIHLTQAQSAYLDLAPDGSAMFLLCTATTVCAALLLRYTVERPFLAVRDFLLRRMKSGPAPVRGTTDRMKE